MDPLKTIGTVLKDPALRDAIHIAVLPVVLGEQMYSGEYVKFAFGTNEIVLRANTREEAIGIVDPFLHEYLDKDLRVWCFMMPGSITGIRHDWAHPKVDVVEGPVSDAELWLRRFAEEWHFDYNEMITLATAGPTADGWKNYIVAHGIDLHSAEEIGEDLARFWRNIEKLTGNTFDETHRANVGWSCSC